MAESGGMVGYTPAKLHFAHGRAHPTPMVESATLSYIEPPDIGYTLSERIVDCPFLDSLQIESVTYASQAHSQIMPSGERKGFLIGSYLLCFHFS